MTDMELEDQLTSKGYRLGNSVIEVFNAFASYYYSPCFPSNNPTSTNFGSLLPVGGDQGDLYNPRVIQLALRLVS